MDALARANGFGNRFLYLWSRLTARLPYGGDVDASAINEIADTIATALGKVDKRIGVNGSVRLELDPGALESILPVAAWTADGKSLVFAANEPGRRRRLFVQPVDGSGPARPITPEGVSRAGQSMIVSPDGAEVLGTGPRRSTCAIGWMAQARRRRYRSDRERHGAQMACRRQGDLDLNTATRPGHRTTRDRERTTSTLARNLLSDPAGLGPDWNRVLVTPDGRGYVYGYSRQLSDLFVVQGLK
jgi:hypothetical protein